MSPVLKHFDARTDYEKEMARLGTDPQVGDRIVIKSGLNSKTRAEIASVGADGTVTVVIAGEKKPRAWSQREWLAQTTRSSVFLPDGPQPEIRLTEEDIRTIAHLAMDTGSDIHVYLKGEDEPRRICRECNHELTDGKDEEHRPGCAAVARRAVHWKMAVWLQERSGDTARGRVPRDRRY